MNAPEDALIAKAAEALWDSLLGKYKRGEFTECPEQHLSWWHEQARGVIATVRDQIAAEALREAASAIDSGDADHEELRQGGIDEIWPKGWSKASVIAARDVGSVWADWLRARADRLDPKEPDHG